jgi:hypothetical protein
VYPITEAFAAALKSSHTVVTLAEVLTSGTVVATLDVLDGSVEVDGAAAVRRRCSVRLADSTGELTPADLSDLLAPNGNEVRLFRGLRLADGDELVPLGVFRIAAAEVAATPAGVAVELSGYDRSRKITRARWTAPYTISSGATYSAALKALLLSRDPAATFDFVEATGTTPALLFGADRDNDPWADAQKLAEAAGCELYVGPTGAYTLRTIPDPGTAPIVWDYREGVDATILAVSKSLDDEQTYNGVIVSGETPELGAPVTAAAWDDDPTSPTYRFGPFGQVPEFFTSSLITSQAQATATAEALLRRKLGAVEDVRFDAIPNPAHEAGDVVRVLVDAARVDGRYVLESFSVPLGPGTMTITTRKRRT